MRRVSTTAGTGSTMLMTLAAILMTFGVLLMPNVVTADGVIPMNTIKPNCPNCDGLCSGKLAPAPPLLVLSLPRFLVSQIAKIHRQTREGVLRRSDKHARVDPYLLLYLLDVDACD